MSSPSIFSMLKHISLVSLSVGCLTACGSVPSTPSTTGANLMGEAALLALTKAPWKLVTVQEGNALPSARLKAGIPANHMRMTIAKDRVSVTGGCNNIGGKVVLGQDGGFKVYDLMSTEMACEAERMQADTEMTEYLTAMAFYEVTQKRLKLMGDQKTLSFVTAALSK